MDFADTKNQPLFEDEEEPVQETVSAPAYRPVPFNPVAGFNKLAEPAQKPNAYLQGFPSDVNKSGQPPPDEGMTMLPPEPSAPAPTPPASRPPRGEHETNKDYLQRILGRQVDPRMTEEMAATLLSQTGNETPLTDTPVARPAGGGGPKPPDSELLRRMIEIETGGRQPTDQKEFDEYQNWAQTREGRVVRQNAYAGDLLKYEREREDAVARETVKGANDELAQVQKKLAFEKGAQEAALVRQGIMQETRKKYQERIAKADKAVDDFRVGDDRNPGERMFGAIAAALGALGSGLTGSPNYALEILEKSIDRRIDAQKVELQKRKERADSKRNDLTEYMNHFQSEEEAAENLRVRYLREQAAAIEQVKLSTKTKQAQTVLDLLQKDRLTKAQMEQNKLELVMEEAAMQRFQGTLGGGGGGAPKGAEPGNYDVITMGWEDTGRYIPAFGGMLLKGNAVAAKDAGDRYMAYAGVEQLADQALARLQSAKRPGVAVDWDKEQAAINAFTNLGMQAISTQEGGGVVTAEDPMREVVDNPKEVYKTYETAIEKWKIIKARAQQRKALLESQYPVTPSDKPVYAGVGPDGKPQFKARVFSESPEYQGQNRRQASRAAGQEVAPSDAQTVQLEQLTLQAEAEIERQNRSQKKTKGKKKKDDEEPVE